MVSVNEHSDIRNAFAGLTMHEVGIKYSVGNKSGNPAESREPVITNYEPGIIGDLLG
ncbi:MAG TPA: adenine modification methytransferase [Betaproteobacteria bacterium]|nr:adenine modification methytransferase [Betaproteobacteria bacterium]